jgi:hypothetical protein
LLSHPLYRLLDGFYLWRAQPFSWRLPWWLWLLGWPHLRLAQLRHSLAYHALAERERCLQNAHTGQSGEQAETLARSVD